MKSLIFFSYGLTKSGSTLAFQLAREALVQAGFEQPRLRVPGLVVSQKINAVQHISEEMAEGLLAEVAALGHPLVLKTHTRPDPPVRAMIARGQARGHIVVRDPRDIALSMLDNGRRSRAAGRPAFSEIVTFDDAITALGHQMDRLDEWLSIPGLPVLDYDRLAFDTVGAARRILADLGIPGDPERVVSVVLGDRFIQFNKGVRDRHKTEMSEAESARFLTRFAPYYEQLAGTAAEPVTPLPRGSGPTPRVDISAP